MASIIKNYDETFRKEVLVEMEDSFLYGSDELFEDIHISTPQMVNLSLQESNFNQVATFLVLKWQFQNGVCAPSVMKCPHLMRVFAVERRIVCLLYRFGQLDIFNRPLCLVFTDDKMNLQIDDSVLHQISLIDVPLSVVGVCGIYRTGKSYLLNKLAQEQTGFSLGNTIRSQTKGIWAWCKPHPTVPDQVLVLLDTEGLSDAAKGDQEHDTKIFSLTMLMSSALIYNMKGVLDQDALNRLSFITEITKKVSVAGSTFSDEEEDKNTLQIISPHFVLCLRDFFYELVDGGEMTPDEYMESCLTESSDKQNEEFNNIRKSIKTFFPRRNCFVLAQPAMNKKLRDLETLRDDQLDPEFREDVQKMIAFLHDLGPKCLDEVTRKCWDGNAFEAFLRTYIRELSSGQKMEYGSAMQGAARYHNSKLKVSICWQYQAELDKLELPEPSKLKLLDIAMKIMYDLLRVFRRDAYPFLVDHFEDKAMETMKRMMEDLVIENSQKVQKLCYGYLDIKHKKMVEKNNTTYDSKDGIRKYEKDFDELLRKYNTKFCDYDSAERYEALQKFKESSKDQVVEMKYQAKLQEEINRYDEMQQSKRVDMELFMKREMEKLKKEQEQKLEEDLNSYKKRLSDLSFGNIGFFKRLKYLLTGNLDVQ